MFFSSKIEELNECIENLLTHMEEFYGLIERIRDQGNLCLDKFQIQLLPKLQECQKLFRFIDKLERIVNHVALQLSLMEREVARAEKMMGTKTSTVKKLFSFLNLTGSLILLWDYPMIYLNIHSALYPNPMASQSASWPHLGEG